MNNTERRQYILDYIRNSSVEAFTNLRLQTALLELNDDLTASQTTDAADFTALSALSGANFKYVFVTNEGVFKYLSSGTPNGTTIFAASGGGTWNLVFNAGVDTPQLSTPVLTLTVEGSTAITADWAAVTDASNYLLYASTASDFTGETLIYDGSSLTFPYTSLATGTQYYFRIKARGYERMNSEFDTDTATTDSVDVLAEEYINAVITAGGTISAPKQVKVDTLITDLRANNLLNKIKALYLYHGNTLAGAAFNAVNPTSILGAFPITWVGSPTLNADGGFTPASGKYGITNFHPDGGGLTSDSGAGMGFYTDGTIGGSEYTMGLFNNFYFAPGQGVVQISGAYKSGVAQTTSGFYFATREPASSNIKTYRNGTVNINTTEAFSVAYSATTVGSFALVGGMKEHPSTIYPSTAPLRLSIFTEGLLAAEVTILNTLIQNYLA